MDKIVSFEKPMDYDIMLEWLSLLQQRYGKHFELVSIGSSWMERQLCCAALGEGEEEEGVVFVGAHHGMEWISSQILLRFLEDILEHLENNARFTGYNIASIFKKNRLYIIPMLNPDGVEISIKGIEPEHFLYDRLVRQNNESADFSHWQANMRGVDLNHNYDYLWGRQKGLEKELDITTGCPSRYGGEAPESEKETRALCDFLRTICPRMLLSFHSQGEEIYCDMGPDAPPKSLNTASFLSHLCGYKLVEASGLTACGGLKDWFMKAFQKPAFTIELGRGENPLPLRDFENVYKKILPVLLNAPVI